MSIKQFFKATPFKKTIRHTVFFFAVEIKNNINIDDGLEYGQIGISYHASKYLN